MTALLSMRRRAEEFAAAVDGRLAPEAAHRSDMSELVGLVTAIRAHDATSPRPEFVETLRGRLMTEAATALKPHTANLVLPVRTRGARERRLVALASAVVLVGGTASMAAASQSALPGEALYPIKRSIEHAQTTLSVSSAGKGRDLLGQASDRLREVQGLLADPSASHSAQVPSTLRDFTKQSQEGSGLLLSSFQDSRDPDLVVRVRQFAADGTKRLQALAQSAPPDTRGQLAEAAAALQDIDQQATTMCTSCAPGLPALEIPKIFLVSSEVERAMRKLEGAHLNNDHPVVADKGAVEKAAQDAARAAARASASARAASGATDGAAVPSKPRATSTAAAKPVLPLPTASAKAGKKLLPGLKDLGKGSKTITDLPSQVVQGLSDDLSGVVETLLPKIDPKKPLP